ncbi:HNH endonuclease family protein [Streptomyces sp. NPDC059340]|uniref:HNH endonuclease family protein n=1 Tax=Streptomyces sp. NPDC059340 TaxID=3346806 RepID=UPI0036B45EFC
MIFERNPVVRFTPAARTAAAALSALAVLLAPTTAHAATPTHVVAPGDTVAMPVRDALQALPVQDENRAGYERTKFRHWIDADKDGCNTRQEVLKAEAVIAPQQGPGCSLTGGEWYSPYDDKYFTDARGLDIDHLVPLAEAWDSGASAWTAKEREAYANDLGDARALIAVSAASNRSKADQDPSTWQPPAQGYSCQYATDWVADKTRWGLTIDPTEHAALTEVLGNCPDQPITVTLAR